MTAHNSHLDTLENHSVFILREANQAFKNMAMPWSMGKGFKRAPLALKAFFGKIPFPLFHIDTTYEFPEMLEFRGLGCLSIWLPVDRENEHGGLRAAYETRELKTVALSTVIKNLEAAEPLTVDVRSRL